jgi:NADH:ubiquinone oxidoreductase subunit E
VKGSEKVLKAVREYLGLREGENTTPDLLFTVETVACIGACALAPVMAVDNEVFGPMDEERARQIIEEIEKRSEVS